MPLWLLIFRFLSTMLCGLVFFAFGVHKGDLTLIGIGIVLLTLANIGAEVGNVKKDV